MTTLSVVVPVLDDAVHLRRLLELLAGQSRVADEIIVVDNGSTDESATVAMTAGALLVREHRRGIPAAAAAGYDTASGDVIVRCDADTRPAADWLLRIERHFAQGDGIDAVTGPGCFYDMPRGVGHAASLFYSVAYFLATGGALARVPLWGSNMAFRRELWPGVRERLDLSAADVHDDLDFTCKLDSAVRVRFDRYLRVGAAGRIFSRSGGLRDSVRMALLTLVVNGGARGVWRRWKERLGRAGG